MSAIVPQGNTVPVATCLNQSDCQPEMPCATKLCDVLLLSEHQNISFSGKRNIWSTCAEMLIIVHVDTSMPKRFHVELRLHAQNIKFKMFVAKGQRTYNLITSNLSSRSSLRMFYGDIHETFLYMHCTFVVSSPVAGTDDCALLRLKIANSTTTRNKTDFILSQ